MVNALAGGCPGSGVVAATEGVSDGELLGVFDGSVAEKVDGEAQGDETKNEQFGDHCGRFEGVRDPKPLRSMAVTGAEYGKYVKICTISAWGSLTIRLTT